MIVTGGVNVYPAESRGRTRRDPFVRSSAVIGLPDDDLGQRVHAIVDVGTADRVGLRNRGTGAPRRVPSRAKTPRTYEFVRELLRNDAGKVRRSALRDARMPGADDITRPRTR